MSALVTASADVALGATAEHAQDAYKQLTDTLYSVAGKMARRADMSFPGLAQAFDDRILLTVEGNPLGALGSYHAGKWQLDSDRYDELKVNVGHVSYALDVTRAQAEDVLTTIGHELTHFYARLRGIRDTSGRGGRYHRRDFAVMAEAIGMATGQSGKSHIGFVTTGLNQRGRERYGDLIEQVVDALRLSATPTPVNASIPTTGQSAGESVVSIEDIAAAATSKYVFAQCECVGNRGQKRTLRMARGHWHPNTVLCAICQSPFVESPTKSAKNKPMPNTAASRPE